MASPCFDRLRTTCAALAMLALASPAGAEPPPPRDWDLALFGYLWMAGLEADVESEFGDVRIDQSFSDILQDLELGAMAALDARYRRFVLFIDGVYTKVGDDSSVANGRVDSDFTVAYADAKAGFRLLDARAPWADASQLEAPRIFFDLLGGARYWYTRLEADGRFPNVSNRQFDKTKDWVDPLVGARVAIGLLPTLNVSVIGDVGGFDIGNGSELTWMVMPTINWRPWEHWSFHAGYKHVKADRERPSTNRDLDIELSGPVLGVGFHF
jgi:hypothetical protein